MSETQNQRELSQLSPVEKVARMDGKVDSILLQLEELRQYVSANPDCFTSQFEASDQSQASGAVRSASLRLSEGFVRLQVCEICGAHADNPCSH